MSQITKIHARQVVDCRGWPTVQVDTYVDGVLAGRADVPSGRSTGFHEAHELRDGGKRYNGLGVEKALANVNDVIAPALIGWNPTEQRKIDKLMLEMDGTPNKDKLGANAILGVSLSAARAGAYSCGLPLYKYLNPMAHILPVPLMNFLNGGKLTANELEIQEFIIMPVGASSYRHALEMTTEINEILRDMVIEKFGILATNTGDEGGFATPMKGIREPFEFMRRAVEAAGYKEGLDNDVVYGMDLAANSWYDDDKKLYTLDGKDYDTDALMELYIEMCNEYPIASMEDPFCEEDFESYAKAVEVLKNQIVGDDLFVTNTERIKMGVEKNAANALLFKVNQIGSLSEALDAAEFSYRNGYGVQVSERSGETEDPIISDLVVALNSGQIKTGMPVRGERTAKHNRLLQIEEELEDTAVYAGKNFSKPQ